MRFRPRTLCLMLCHTPKCGRFLLKACVSSLLTTNFILGLCSLIFLIIMFCQLNCFVSTLKTYHLADFFFLSSLYLTYCLVCGDFQGCLLLLVLKRVICKVILFPGYCQNCLCRVSAVEDTKPIIRGLKQDEGRKYFSILRGKNLSSACLSQWVSLLQSSFILNIFFYSYHYLVTNILFSLRMVVTE